MHLPGGYFVADSQEPTYCIGFNFWCHLLSSFIVSISSIWECSEGPFPDVWSNDILLITLLFWSEKVLRLWVVVVSGFIVCVNWRNPETAQCLSPISLSLHRSVIVLTEADIIDCLFITVKARMKWVCFFPIVTQSLAPIVRWKALMLLRLSSQ